jgi:hypothetical protein
MEEPMSIDTEEQKSIYKRGELTPSAEEIRPATKRVRIDSAEDPSSYCHICEAGPLTSLIQKQQHESSKGHKKKQADFERRLAQNNATKTAQLSYDVDLFCSSVIRIAYGGLLLQETLEQLHRQREAELRHARGNPKYLRSMLEAVRDNLFLERKLIDPPLRKALLIERIMANLRDCKASPLSNVPVPTMVLAAMLSYEKSPQLFEAVLLERQSFSAIIEDIDFNLAVSSGPMAAHFPSLAAQSSDISAAAITIQHAEDQGQQQPQQSPVTAAQQLSEMIDRVLHGIRAEHQHEHGLTDDGDADDDQQSGDDDQFDVDDL